MEITVFLIVVIILINQFKFLSAYEKLHCFCGIKLSVRLRGRVVNGRQAILGDNPWIAAITDLHLHDVFCGGTLINNRYILTAAHCFNDIDHSTIRVMLGIYDLENRENVVVYSADKIIIHENYDPDSSSQKYDIALIRLDKNVTYTESIEPACLPPRNVIRSFDYLKVIGWGATSESGDKSSVLMEAFVEEKPLEDCQKLLTDKRITESHICAGNWKYDSCTGDSGGPLMTKMGTRAFVVGIVSWGIECASLKYPGVYTRVSSYGMWIYQNSMDALYCDNQP